MDPLSVTASIIAILQISNKVIGYLNDVKDAPKDRAKCAIEASNLHSLLTNLRFRLEGGDVEASWFTAVRALAVENGPLDQFKGALGLLQDKLIIDRGSLGQVGTSLIWKFRKDEVEHILQCIERLKALVGIALQMDHFKLSQAIKDDTNSMQNSMSTLQARVDSLQLYQDSAHLDQLKSWFSQTDSVAQQSDVLHQRQEGTGQWFLDTLEFSEWIRETNVGDTLFCTGIPGAGKTIMAAVAIDHLITKVQKKATGLAWVYCSYKSRTDQTAVSLLSMLLRQLMHEDKPRIIELVGQLHKQHTSQKTRPTARDIVKILRAAIMEFSTVYFVIDALDECSADDGTRRRFVKDLEALQLDTDLRLMITSRNIPQVVDQFADALKIEVRAHDEDVKDFLAGQLDQLPRCVQKDAALQKEIQEKIAGVIDGMFLLARLYVDSLLDKRTKSKVQITLDALSKQSQTLENAYEDAVKRLRSQLPGDAALATRVLTWIIYAERALTTSELRHALAVELGQANLDEDNVLDIEDIVAVCAGLVTVDKKSDIVRLVHYTTQEYFKSMREDWNPDGQLDITRTCLTYLSFKAFRSKSFSIYTEFKAHFNDYPFLDYAAQYWGTHAVSVKAEVSELARAALLNKNPAPNLALLYASFRGHIEIVKLLLDYGADLSITHAETGWTPLGFAVSEGHIETVKLLLDYGADPDIADTDSWTPLLNASSEGHVEIVKLLLDNGADSSIADVGTGWTPFITAIQRGYREVVELLLPTGIGMNNTVLWLTRRGYTDLLKLSHERHNGDLQIINSHNENLLHVAAKHGQIDTFLFLVGRGLDPLAKDAKGADLLCCVALSNSLELCNIVLNMGILPSTQTGRWTPLHWACKIGNSDVIERLVQAGMESSGVSISNPDRTWYPVDVAIFHGHEDILPNLTHSCKIALGPVSDPDRIVGKVDESKICDGCDQNICGPGFRCYTCGDFDYCFMCKPFLDHLHEKHEWGCSGTAEYICEE